MSDTEAKYVIHGGDVSPALFVSARGGGEGGRGFRGGVPLPHTLGPYPYLTLALIILVTGGYWVYLRSRR